MTLLQGEHLLRQERIHPGIFIIPALLVLPFLFLLLPVFLFMRMLTAGLGTAPNWWFLLLILFPMFILLVPAFLVTLVAYLKSEITLTNKRLLFRAGLLARLSGEVPLENVETILMVEPLLGHLLGYGTVTVTTLGGSTFPITCIGKPHVFHAVLQNAVTAAKATTRPPQTPAPSDDSRYMPRLH
jgi:uncharacterized membrane protein YdbT with pleckstrin-like domain